MCRYAFGVPAGRGRDDRGVAGAGVLVRHSAWELSVEGVEVQVRRAGPPLGFPDQALIGADRLDIGVGVGGYDKGPTFCNEPVSER